MRPLELAIFLDVFAGIDPTGRVTAARFVQATAACGCPDTSRSVSAASIPTVPALSTPFGPTASGGRGCGTRTVVQLALEPCCTTLARRLGRRVLRPRLIHPIFEDHHYFTEGVTCC
jgi:hypothetical protein